MISAPDALYYRRARLARAMRAMAPLGSQPPTEEVGALSEFEPPRPVPRLVQEIQNRLRLLGPKRTPLDAEDAAGNLYDPKATFPP